MRLRQPRQGEVARVKLSAFGASAHSNSVIAGCIIRYEKELQESDWLGTMLRPHHFMQNLLGQLTTSSPTCRLLSSGDGRIPFVDTRDNRPRFAASPDRAGATPGRSTSSRGVRRSYVTGKRRTPWRRRWQAHCVSSTNPSASRAHVSREPASQRGCVDTCSRFRPAYQRARGPRMTDHPCVVRADGNPRARSRRFARDPWLAAFSTAPGLIVLRCLSVLVLDHLRDMSEKAWTPQLPLGFRFRTPNHAQACARAPAARWSTRRHSLAVGRRGARDHARTSRSPVRMSRVGARSPAKAEAALAWVANVEDRLRSDVSDRHVEVTRARRARRRR